MDGNGFTGRAQNFAPPFTPRRERESGKALVFVRPLAWIIHDFASKKRKGALKD
jgi:hypothetical protein